MFIPYELFDVVLFASEESTRYAIGGVSISRGNALKLVKLAATDGQRMIHVEYDDTAFRNQSKLADEVVPGFACVLSVQTINQVREIMRNEYEEKGPRNAQDHALRCVHVAESLKEYADKRKPTATITLLCGDETVVLDATPEDGEFPNTDGIIPEHTPTNSVAFGISPELLGTSAELLHNMQQHDDDLRGVICTAMVERNKAITLYASRSHPLGGEIRTTVVIIPVSIESLGGDVGQLDNPHLQDGHFGELLEHARNLVAFVAEMKPRSDALTLVAERLADRLARFEGFLNWHALTAAKEKIGSVSYPLSPPITDGCDAQ